MPARVSSPRFIGRAAELVLLESALARAAAGRSASVLLGGDAGMGKSRLVAEFERRAVDAGAEVLVGECVEMDEGALPYGAILAALRPLVSGPPDGPLKAIHPGARAPLARLWPELTASDGAGPGLEFAQSQLFEAVHRLIAVHAAERPVALMIEDLQWADRSTRDLLAFLIRNSRGERVLFVASYRTDEVHRRHPLHPFVSELERSGRAERLTLPAFGEDELREQLSGILGEEPSPQLVRRLLERSEGNPFFAEELLAAADQGVIPDSLREALLVRVERLSGAARRTLELAAAVGRPAGHQLLASASRLGPDDLRDALREAVEHRVLVPTDDGAAYAFRHSLLREAVYADLLPGERATLHAALGEALSADRQLAESGRAAAELASHWYAAGRAGPALSASLAAAAQAEGVHAYAEASRHLERALDLWEHVPAEELGVEIDVDDVARRAAEAAIFCGAHGRAISIARQLVAENDPDADPVGAGLAHARLARFLWTDGHGDAALEHYEIALELVPPEPSTERAQVLAASAHVLMLLGRIHESRIRGEQALEIARAAGARLVEASVLNTLGPAHSSGEREENLHTMQAARAIAEELGAVEEVGRSYVNECHVLEELGRLEESVTLAEKGIARARELGAERWWGDYLATEVSDRLFALGNWDDAALRARDVLDFTSNALNAASSHTSLGRIAAERGDFEKAKEHVALSEELSARSGGPMWAAPNRAILAVCALWAGDPEQARSLVAAAVEDLGASELLLFTSPLYSLGVRAEADRAERARALGRSGETQAAELAARALLDRFEKAPEDSPKGVGHERAVAEAELSRLRGEHDPEPWLALAQRWRRVSHPYRAAYAEWRAADTMIRSGGAPQDAERLLSSAHETATRLGARPLQVEISSLARRARLDLVGPSPAPSIASYENELGLTDREREVLLLLVAGRTNRQIGEELFMSEKTASVHVSRILSKLGVANRAEAAGVAHTLGLRPGVAAGGSDRARADR